VPVARRFSIGRLVSSPFFLGIGALLALLPAGPAPHRTADGQALSKVRTIPLAGPVADSQAEISGLAGRGDTLFLLPQHPFRMAAGRAEHGLLYALPKTQLRAFLAGRSEGPLRPRPVPLVAPRLRERSPVYQGCEALAFGDGAYLTTEAVADAETGAMRGFLFKGHLQEDTLRLNERRRVTLPPQTSTRNMAYEALVVRPRRVLVFYEANGRNVNPQPLAAAFSPALRMLRPLAFPPLEYRLTDATAPNAGGRFWATNYFFPGEREKLDPAADPLAASNGSTSRHAPRGPVERLVEFRVKRRRIERTATPPLRLSARPGAPRNWEGVARLRTDARGDGFLLATDQYPRTLLAFVAASGGES
jgi:hypothetical protein